jgi:hypothetical protein
MIVHIIASIIAKKHHAILFEELAIIPRVASGGQDVSGVATLRLTGISVRSDKPIRRSLFAAHAIKVRHLFESCHVKRSGSGEREINKPTKVTWCVSSS